MVLAKDEYDPNYASDAIIIVMEKEKPIDMPADRETTDRDKSSEVDTGDWEEHRENAEKLRNKERIKPQTQANIEASGVGIAEGLANKPTENEASFLFAGPIKNYIAKREEPDTPFTLSKEEIRDFFFSRFMPREPKFSFVDRLILKRSQYEDYLKNKKYLEKRANEEYEAEKGDTYKRAIIPQRLADALMEVVRDSDYTLAIHYSSRVHGELCENDPNLYKIMRDGLTNYGDAMTIGGNIVKNPSLDRAVSFIYSALEIKQRLTSRYKGSTGGVILIFPNNLINPLDGSIKEGMEDIIYSHDEEGWSTIKPEYIIGFVQNLGAGSICKFVSRDEILKCGKNQELLS